MGREHDADGGQHDVELAEDYVLELLGDRGTDVSTERRTLTVERHATPEEFRDCFKARYGPTIAVYRSLADEPERAAELDAALADLARRADRGQGTTVVDWEYLLLTATTKRETVPGPR